MNKQTQLIPRSRGHVDILVGLSFGDEGKGKISDTITPQYDVIARVNGSGNAGHTVCDGTNKHVVHYIPCGFLYPGKILICGAGMAINPVDYTKEVIVLEKNNPDLRRNLYVSHQATLITPIHISKDIYRESGIGSLGSTKKGVSFGYADDTEHKGLRMLDIVKYSTKDFLSFYKEYREKERKLFPRLPIFLKGNDLTEEENIWLKYIDKMRSLKIQIVDTVQFANQLLAEGKNILIEGAQSPLLDVRLGHYPYNTSSHTTPQMLLGYAGLPPGALRDVFGVMKPYITRVGGIPPLSVMDDDTDKIFREEGHEFGSTTGRARKCAWTDEVLLRQVIDLCHPTKIYITKMDVCPVDVVKIAVGYLLKNGKNVLYPPMNLNDFESVVYKEIPGWKFENNELIPENAINFIAHIKKLFPFIEIAGIGVGPNREDIMYLSNNDLNKIDFVFEYS
ncbi:adenylosuccinate synthetase [Candidatus Nomurabacteria bacterium]|nr:adenylosuccinate synthetase [Candidatus Nomurabacteria bacterium]